MKQRIEYLDAIRGLAILLVFGYHAFSRWPGIVPYGNAFADFPVFMYGWLGVPLFFLISGFVILMTLEKSSGIVDFLVRRWLRLFPGMLICSLLVFATSPLLHERPAGVPSWTSLLPGLTFVEPSWISRLIGSPIKPLEGAFWSLFVEFKFYVMASIVYFVLPRRIFTHVIFGAFVVWLLGQQLLLIDAGVAARVLAAVTSALSFHFFGYFAAGAEFYKYSRSGDSKRIWLALALALASSFGLPKADAGAMAGAALMSIFFAACVYSTRLQEAISIRILLFFGLISYPLYLIHENALISIVVKLAAGAPSIPGFALPLAALAVLSVLAYIIATRLETPLRSALRAALERLSFTARTM